MAKNKREKFELDIRPSVEFLGLEKVIDQIGKKRVLDQIGKKRYSKSLTWMISLPTYHRPSGGNCNDVFRQRNRAHTRRA